MPSTSHFIAWWNLENLFDVENDPLRIPWLQKELKNYLKGWTKEVLDKKISNLAKVIRQLNNNQGPDLMGFCEIENRHVIEMLVEKLHDSGKHYGIVHKEMNDHRGIDIAFIYNKAHFALGSDPIFSLEVMKRTSTRDLLQVTFKTKNGNDLIVIGNHWPSRSGGQYESEPFHIMVAETLSYWLQRIEELKGEAMPVLLMGDFNDEPFNRSLAEYAMSVNNTVKISNAVKPSAGSQITVRIPYLYNLMWKFPGEPRSTFVYGGVGNILDQFLVNRAIALPLGKFKVGSVDIADHFDGIKKGEYNAPVKFGAPSKASEFNANGFSDHFPISLNLMEE